MKAFLFQKWWLLSQSLINILMLLCQLFSFRISQSLFALIPKSERLTSAQRSKFYPVFGEKLSVGRSGRKQVFERERLIETPITLFLLQSCLVTLRQD